jgi:hypothetical protein
MVRRDDVSAFETDIVIQSAKGISGRRDRPQKFLAYLAFAASASSRILAIAFTSCSKVSALEGIGKLNAVPRRLPLSIVIGCGAATRASRFGLALTRPESRCRPSSHHSAAGSDFEAPSRDPQFIRGLQ